MSNVRPSKLETRLENGSGPFVLDIRPADAYETDAIPSSYNIPVYDDLRQGNESSLRRRLDEIPDSDEVVVVCQMGIVAKKARSVLLDEGYEATVLTGGMSGWRGYQRNSLGYRILSLFWKVR